MNRTSFFRKGLNIFLYFVRFLINILEKLTTPRKLCSCFFSFRSSGKFCIFSTICFWRMIPVSSISIQRKSILRLAITALFSYSANPSYIREYIQVSDVFIYIFWCNKNIIKIDKHKRKIIIEKIIHCSLKYMGCIGQSHCHCVPNVMPLWSGESCKLLVPFFHSNLVESWLQSNLENTLAFRTQLIRCSLHGMKYPSNSKISLIPL